MSEVTQVLSVIEGGDPAAPAKLLPLVYEVLRTPEAVWAMTASPRDIL